MANFTVGQLVAFNRNSATNSASTPVCGIVPAQELPQSVGATYVIEHPSGWTPDSMRKSKYNLDENKKYLFVSESELSAI